MRCASATGARNSAIHQPRLFRVEGHPKTFATNNTVTHSRLERRLYRGSDFLTRNEDQLYSFTFAERCLRAHIKRLPTLPDDRINTTNQPNPHSRHTLDINMSIYPPAQPTNPTRPRCTCTNAAAIHSFTRQADLARSYNTAPSTAKSCACLLFLRSCGAQTTST